MRFVSDAQRRAVFAKHNSRFISSDFKYYIDKDGRTHEISRPLTSREFNTLITFEDEYEPLYEYGVIPYDLAIDIGVVQKEVAK